jgi:hypothetical protein
MTLTYRLYHFVVGAAGLIDAAMAYSFLALSILLVLFSVFMISRALLASVTLSPSSVTLKGLFLKNSVQRSSIIAIERQHTDRGNYLTRWVNLEEKKGLTIGDLFAFDQTWDDWLSTYRDISDDKPLRLF